MEEPLHLTWEITGAVLVLGVASTGGAYVLNYRHTDVRERRQPVVRRAPER